MKNIGYLIVLLFAVNVFIGCKQHEASIADETRATSDTANQSQNSKDTVKKIELGEDDLASKKDPVCDMPVRKYMEDTTTYEGKIYAFCSKDCKDEFLKNPKQYLSKKD